MKTVIVTGGGAGIGRETAKLFARKGSRVIVADIDEAGAEETVAAIKSADGEAVPYRLDVRSEDQWEDFAGWVRTVYGGADVLINNAGVMDLGGFVETTIPQWQRMIDINLMSVVYGSKVFAKQMIDTGVHGHIVNISSGAAFLPSQLEPAYGVAKIGVLMATQSLRVELRKHNIGVTAICPGVIRTNLLANGERNGLTAEQQAEWKAQMGTVQTSLGFGGPDKVARVIERSVRNNWAIVPVNPEAWLGYGLFRLSPTLLRTVASVASYGRIDSLITTARPLLDRLTK
ncbi:SDR family NAD(P)-dependent oxidoreductase [Antrihabitans sp. YC3-6]|uniref:SDR family NAD(P)-dependent oxidoreductase n=1 Tax=Antrihabitans stalagmiti TaxID=2799499 RepID=A0A934NV76_9NOCA|nr:SDR family NAD(P)-dependent oxidoreductase [Antrihabitans stalagmiti]MBJ8342021.1 SDR family NAD(P)-dependent oxidoreductase [Antrihabitans stalagmiti]